MTSIFNALKTTMTTKTTTATTSVCTYISRRHSFACPKYRTKMACSAPRVECLLVGSRKKKKVLQYPARKSRIEERDIIFVRNSILIRGGGTSGGRKSNASYPFTLLVTLTDAMGLPYHSVGLMNTGSPPSKRLWERLWVRGVITL